jgi:ubiquinone/menaquinone biosynthesis C-methylase UbiE
MVIAERYDTGRPQLHGLALNAFSKEIGLKHKWNRVLDIACGTGHSSVPLLGLSNRVVGIDVSESMIQIAKRNQTDIDFIVSSAERLPSGLGTFNAIFIANGFHWINKQELLGSIKDSLSFNGWFVIYGLGAPRTMLGNPNYDNWYKNDYLKRYPKPITLGGSFSQFVSASGGVLSSYSSINIVHNMALSCLELQAMITSQSNIHQALDNGLASIEEIDSYFESVLPTFFSNENEVFPFNIKIEYSLRQ